MRYLLDTNICIYIIKQKPEGVHQRFKQLSIGDIGISAITFCELQFGVANSANIEKNQLALTRFLGPLEIIDFPAGAASTYGSIKKHLFSRGTPIGNFDLLIAAHAIHQGLILVTNNVKEFKRVPGLNVENWA